MVKCLRAQAEARPNAICLRVDLRRAFQKMHRPHAFRAMAAADAEMATYLGTGTPNLPPAFGATLKVSSQRSPANGALTKAAHLPLLALR